MSSCDAGWRGVKDCPAGYHGYMKPATIVGIILIVIGIVALAYQGITYTTSEKVVDLGPLKVEAKRERTIPLPPVVGVVALVGGIVLVAVSGRK
jgi:uncharacterized membrane protein HdeD (DUF308 family)